MQLLLKLPAESDLPVYRQVSSALKEAVVAGFVKSGDKLPSARELAYSMRLARLTVVRAYHDLSSQGYIQVIPGSGTYVTYNSGAQATADLEAVTAGATADSTGLPELQLSPWARSVMASEMLSSPSYDAFEELNFCASDLDLLPRTHWQKVLYKSCRLADLSVISYVTDPFGHPTLREAIAGYLARARSLKCSPDQIAVFPGTESGGDLLGRVLLQPGNTVAVENPGPPGVRHLYSFHGAELFPVPVDEAGLVVRRLADCPQPVKLVYVTPSHQDPTGAVLSLERRHELLKWAAKTNAIVIEDDFDSEYRYGDKPLPALKGLDRNDAVVYRFNFWKSLFPMVRAGFLVLPWRLVQPVRKAKLLVERDVPLLEQRALADFIDEGHFERHISRTRSIYAKRRARLVQALTKRFRQLIHISPVSAGLHLTVRFSPDWDEDHIQRCAGSAGFPLLSSKNHYMTAPKQNEFLLAFAALKESDIPPAVQKFADELGPAETESE